MAVQAQAERHEERLGHSWHDRTRGLAARIKQNLSRQRELILAQVLAIQGLMQLLMKPRNTGVRWTPQDLQQIRGHLRTLVWLIPTLLIFLPPGGMLLLPVLAEVLDRRRTPRP
jgi:hypothetical protein